MDRSERNGETDEAVAGASAVGTSLMSRLSLEEKTKEDENSVSGSGDEENTCSVCYDVLQYPIKLPCDHLFCFLCIKGAHAANRLCPMCRARIPSAFILNPELLSECKTSNSISKDSKPVRKVVGQRTTRSMRKNKKTADSVFWCYESKRQYKTWWKYDERTSTEIETAYQKFTKNSKSETGHLDLQITGKIYRIDFKSKEQYLSNGDGRRRLIERSTDLVDGSDTIVGTAGIKQLK